jgi:hypothetical protein
MKLNQGGRVGDEIMMKGMSIKMFLENPIDRCKTHYRILFICGVKDKSFTRTIL